MRVSPASHRFHGSASSLGWRSAELRRHCASCGVKRVRSCAGAFCTLLVVLGIIPERHLQYELLGCLYQKPQQAAMACKKPKLQTSLCICGSHHSTVLSCCRQKHSACALPDREHQPRPAKDKKGAKTADKGPVPMRQSIGTVLLRQGMAFRAVSAHLLTDACEHRQSHATVELPVQCVRFAA